MGNAQRSTHHTAPSVIVEVRLRLRLSAQRELLGIGGSALPLDGQIAVDALTPAVSAIADQPAVAIASRPVAASRATENTTPPRPPPKPPPPPPPPPNPAPPPPGPPPPGPPPAPAPPGPPGAPGA